MKLKKAVSLSPRDFSQLLGRRLREHREQCKIRQADFAAELGVSQGMLSRWETGASFVTVQRLHEICRRLGTDIETVLKGLV